MKKQTIIILIGMALAVSIFVVCANLLAASFLSGIQKEREPYKEKLGQKFILEKDTLTILDYSQLDETFTLSNGTKINASLVLRK